MVDEGVDIVADEKIVEKDDFVKVHYKGTLGDGSVFDSSEGREPLAFQVGAGQMIKGFDAAVVGMKVGEKKTITMEPADAYGESNADLIKSIGRDQLGEMSEVSIGQVIYANSSGGSTKGVITAVDDTNVTIDFNHDLAGKALT
ncbi:MAG: peptidylprolyl isomerase, partial [Candidatus Diapherotrites archaeon]|nr:peptidylprolyl isomerase [Candidatus Diapherotrites archaeon]